MVSSLAKNRPCGRPDANGNNIAEFYLEESFRGEYSGNNLIYTGYARPGASEDVAVWQISKIAYDGNGNPLSIKWPTTSDGRVSNDYEFAWTDRSSYNYQ